MFAVLRVLQVGLHRSGRFVGDEIVFESELIVDDVCRRSFDGLPQLGLLARKSHCCEAGRVNLEVPLVRGLFQKVGFADLLFKGVEKRRVARQSPHLLKWLVLLLVVEKARHHHAKGFLSVLFHCIDLQLCPFPIAVQQCFTLCLVPCLLNRC